jgi:hypothetical protein
VERARWPPADPSPAPRSIAEPLSSGESDEILGALAAFPAGFQSVAGGMVKDGFPCQLLVARRHPPAEAELSFNLAGLGPEVQDPPVVLARHLLGLSRSVDGDPMTMGATDVQGNVTIGTV